MRLSDKLRELASDISLYAGADDSSHVVACLRQAADEYDSKQDKLISNLSERLQSVDKTMHDRTIGLAEQITEVDAKRVEFVSEYGAKITGASAVLEDIGDQERRIERLMERISALENNVDDNAALGDELIRKTKEELLSKITAVEERVLHLSRQTADVGLAGIQDSLWEAIMDRRKEIEAMGKKLTKANSLKRRLASVEKSLGKHGKALDDLQERVNSESSPAREDADANIDAPRRGVWCVNSGQGVPKPRDGDYLAVAASYVDEISLYWRDDRDPDGCWRGGSGGSHHHLHGSWVACTWMLLPRLPNTPPRSES